MKPLTKKYLEYVWEFQNLVFEKHKLEIEFQKTFNECVKSKMLRHEFKYHVQDLQFKFTSVKKRLSELMVEIKKLKTERLKNSREGCKKS